MFPRGYTVVVSLRKQSSSDDGCKDWSEWDVYLAA